MIENSVHVREDQFNLLPPSFRYQNRLRRVQYGWGTLVCFLLAAFLGITAKTVVHIRHSGQSNQQLAFAAIPLMQLRTDVLRLQEENEQRTRWCRWVESARPDDSMLQVLGAIAVASDSSNQEILVDAVDLRLPIESPADASEPPAWAVSTLSIDARLTSSNADVTRGWVERLESTDRITAVSVSNDRKDSAARLRVVDNDVKRVHVTATPLATRVHP